LLFTSSFLIPQRLSPRAEARPLNLVFPDSDALLASCMEAGRSAGLDHVYKRQERTGTKALTYAPHSGGRTAPKGRA
jgi:hypothetical protein